MKPDKNKIVSALMDASGSIENAPQGPDDVEIDSKSGLETMASELMGAFEAKDVSAIASIIKSMIDVCKESEPEESEQIEQ